MFICSDGHEEICHEHYKCPLCEKIGECEDLESMIKQRDKEITALEDELIDKNTEIRSLNDEIEGLNDNIRQMEKAE